MQPIGIFKNSTVYDPIEYHIIDTSGVLVFSSEDKPSRDLMYEYLLSTGNYVVHDLRLNTLRDMKNITELH